MTENARVLSALADAVNAAHAALCDLNVPLVLEGEALSLPERIAWLNQTRPAPAGTSVPADRAPASDAGATGGGRAAIAPAAPGTAASQQRKPWDDPHVGDTAVTVSGNSRQVVGVASDDVVTYRMATIRLGRGRFGSCRLSTWASWCRRHAVEHRRDARRG
jgi:hypothetical protein